MALTLKRWRYALMAMVLVAGAVGLWLSAAQPGTAASADQTQGMTVNVRGHTISWGDAAGCVQNMVTADFGTVVPASTVEQGEFTGCVTSSGTYSVSARGTKEMTQTPGTATIPNFNVVLRATAVPNGGSGPCGPNLCRMSVPQTVVTNGPSGTSQFKYFLSLSVPADTPPGNYTGGELTFTASN